MWAFARRHLGFLCFAGGGVIGAILFLLLYGKQRVNPANVNWLLDGSDPMQHYLGWRAWLESPWSFPFGSQNILSYPTSVPIFYTDSMPLWSVVMKAASGLFPQPFQTLGLFALVAFALQGAFGALLLHKLRLPVFAAAAGAVMLCLMPAMILRVLAHTALASHWVILAALTIWASDRAARRAWTIPLAWGGLALVTSGTHAYLLPMLLAILAGQVVDRLLRRTSWKAIAALVATPVLAMAAGLWVFGAFGVNAKLDQRDAGPENYSANLNSFFNSAYLMPDGFFPGFPWATQGGREGFAYLGFGVILLAASAVVAWWFHRPDRLPGGTGTSSDGRSGRARWVTDHPFRFGLLVSGAIAGLVSLSTRVSLGDVTLLYLRYPEPVVDLLMVFRAMGRFVWVPMYILTVAAFVAARRYIKRTALLALVIVVSLVCQWTEVRSSELMRPMRAFSTSLQDPAWGELRGYSHVNLAAVDLDVSAWALENGLTTNRFYYSRQMPLPGADAVTPDTLVVFNADPIAACVSDHVWKVDDLLVGVPDDTTGNALQVFADRPEDRSWVIRPAPGMVSDVGKTAKDGTLVTDGSTGAAWGVPDITVPAGCALELSIQYEVLAGSAETVGEFSATDAAGQAVFAPVQLAAPTGGAVATTQVVSLETTEPRTIRPLISVTQAAVLRVHSLTISSCPVGREAACGQPG